jgi:hypothetical protein
MWDWTRYEDFSKHMTSVATYYEMRLDKEWSVIECYYGDDYVRDIPAPLSWLTF